MANPNLINNSGVLVAHYLRRITEKLDLGAEYVYQTDPKIPGNFLKLIDAYKIDAFQENKFAL